MKSRPPKYSTNPGVQGEVEPGSRGRVLRNKLGIAKKSEMDAAEINALASAQDRYLNIVSDRTVFTAAFVRDMHRDWLGSIYEWAGTYRTVELSKGGFAWPPASRVADNMTRLEKDLLRPKTPFQAASIDEAATDLAVIHAELLLIHPFREGNGRLARWMADLMCLQAGLPEPDYGFVGTGSHERSNQYLKAVIQGYGQDYSDLADFFRAALERSTNA